MRNLLHCIALRNLEITRRQLQDMNPSVSAIGYTGNLTMQSMSGRPKLTNILANCGEISALLHETDWSATPFGPLEVWPPSLQTAASLCLCSRSPALIWWGPEFNLIYNDACRLMLGATEHPRAMGQPGRNCWPEIWCLIGPMLDQVYRE